MKKSQCILQLKNPRFFNRDERKLIIEEYLSGNHTKQFIWHKYTGQSQERGRLIRWMRALGYPIISQKPSFAAINNYIMAKQKTPLDIENLELKRRINELEKNLVDSELKALAFDTMINVAEKELKICIRKK